MNRRQFAFWVSFGMFSLAEKLRIPGLDRLAAATLNMAEPTSPSPQPSPARGEGVVAATPVHWTAAENGTWRWYVRETFVDGQWKVTGITTPIHKETGQRYSGRSGYLDELQIPADIRLHDPEFNPERVTDPQDRDADDAPQNLPLPPAADRGEGAAHRPDAARRARHGRPPSHWLRSLHAGEIRVWLKTIDVPEAGVEGMTYWEHLTRDHFFDADHIAGLTIAEQAKLHAAAHFGY